MLPDPLRTKIEYLIVALQAPLTAAEAETGWDQALKVRWADWFVELLADLESGNETPPGWGILRAMDFDGVSDSVLAEEGSTVGRPFFCRSQALILASLSP